MLRPVVAILMALTCAFPAASQAQPTLFATPDYLFVMRGNEIFQFEIHSMRLKNRVELPAPAATGEVGFGFSKLPDGFVDALRAEAGAVEEVEEMVEEEPIELEDVTEEVVEERALPPIEDAGPERSGGAGGKYGGRSAGAERLVRGDGKASAAAIQQGLRWLAAHQDPSGRWDADGFMKLEKGEERSAGAGRAVNDVGVTGLALLAFLGDGSTMRSGPYRDSVKRAVSWLHDQQDPDTGLIGTQANQTFIYDHAIATLAMVEAYGLSDYRVLKSTAQRAINYLESHRNPYAVWRYQPRDGDNDTSITSWCVLAYRAAKDFKLEVNEQALKLAETWLDQMTDPVSGRTGYTERGGLSSRAAGQHATLYPREANEAMTAAALVCRFFLGQSPKENPIMTQQADLILRKPPRWEEGAIDEYAWYLGSVATYQMGGRHWREWSRHLDDAVVKTQRHDGPFAGSWDPVGVWGHEGGRVFSTAMLCLTLETYYRYTRLVR